MAYGRKNRVKVDPFAYNQMYLGESGIGKTTLVYKMCEKYLGEDGYLFIECGKENGEEAIEGINAVRAVSWETPSDEEIELYNSLNPSDDEDGEGIGGFEDIIDDIVTNKATEYPNLKVVVVDTYDELIKIAEPEVIAMHNRENPDKRVTSIKAAFGGFMAGEDKVDEIILEKLFALNKVGVHFVVIGHTKRKEREDVFTGINYSQIAAAVGDRHFGNIKTKIPFLGVCFIDRDIVMQKTGKKNVVTKKEEERGKIMSESRCVMFRDDNYSIDSKSRFAEITNKKIPLNEQAVYEAMVEAIKKEKERGGKSYDNDAANEKKLEVKREQAIAEYTAKEKAKRDVAEGVNKIKAIVDDHKSDVDFLNHLKSVLAKLEIKSINASLPLEKINALLSELAEYE